MKCIGRQFRIVVLTGICVFLIALGVQPNPVSAQSTAIVLNFSTLPGDGWEYIDGGSGIPEATIFSLSNGNLHYNTIGFGGISAKYHHAITLQQPFTLTVRARVLDYGDQTNQTPHGLSLGVWTGAELFELGISPGRIIGDGSNGAVTTFSTSLDVTQFHDYRMEGIPGIGYELFVDNVSLGTAPLWNDQGTNNYIEFGDGTRGANASADIASVTFTQTEPVEGPDPALSGCYVYAPDQVNEGQTFTSVIKCHDIASNAFGFQFGTTFTAPLVMRNGVPNTAVALQLGSTSTAGNFAPTNPLVGMNSLSNLYAISHQGIDTTTGDFTLGTFYTGCVRFQNAARN
jgi:hypothetical protein